MSPADAPARHRACRASLVAAVVAVASSLTVGASPAGAREVVVVGLPHLQQLDRAPNPNQHAAVIEKLEGERTLLLIGAAHHPFLERALQAQPWVRTVPARELLADR